MSILNGRASAAEPMVHSTLPNVDEVGTLSVDVPTAQALVARPGSKASDGNLSNDDPGLLNFTAAESEIICQMSSRL
jgi:hypothetical protein